VCKESETKEEMRECLEHVLDALSLHAKNPNALQYPARYEALSVQAP